MPQRSSDGELLAGGSLGAWPRLLCNLAGWIAIFVSAALLALVLVRSGVGLNVLNGWTIFGCALAGVLVVASENRGMIVAAAALMFAGAAPAVIGGMGLLYFPSLFLLLLALVWPHRA